MKNPDPQAGAASSVASATRGRPPAVADAPPAPTLPRNLSVNAYFRELATQHVPRLRYAGQDVSQWRAELLPAVRATLGRMPSSVPLNAQCRPSGASTG
jgi:hypothetical protein